MKLVGLFVVLIGLVQIQVQAQETPDLFAQKRAKEQAAANRDYAERMNREQQRLLNGMQRLPSGLNHQTAKCSSGWRNDDFVHQAGNICNSIGCIGYYVRPSDGATGSIFTCQFYLNNGSQCHAEGFSSPRMGYSVHCVNTKLQDVPRKLIYTD